MFERIFAPASIDSLFSDTAMLAAMARFENGLARAASSGIMPTEAWACARPFSKRAMAASMAVSEIRESIEAGAMMRSIMG